MTYDGFIAGLGNPGPRYSRTRHNFGFMLVDRLIALWADQPDAVISSRSGSGKADVWDVCFHADQTRWLVAKPLDFMNRSGPPIQLLCRRNGIPAERILVLHDELDLPLGQIRFKFSGGLAGHNGLKSLVESLGTKDFARLRLGIGRPEHPVAMADYVLSPFMASEIPVLDKTLARAAEATQTYCRYGLAEAMQQLHSHG